MNDDRMSQGQHRIAAATDDFVRARRPVHLWIIGIIALIWNLPSALEYLAVNIGYRPYLAQFSAEQIGYYESFPLWVDVSWGVAVWAALIGSILLLARSRHALPLFGLSLLGMIATTIWQFVIAETGPVELMGNVAILMIALIWTVAAGLFLYALDMRRRRVLR